MRWQGGSYQVNWTNNRIASNQNNNIYNPAYSAGFQAVYVQPILANRKIDQTRTNLLTTEIQQDVAELDLRATTASTVAQVRNAYWELVFAILNLENQRASLDLSSKLVQDNRARVEIGTMAPIDIVQAQAEEATRRQNLVNAEATLQNTELALKRLIVSGTDDPLWTASIDATDRPAPGAEAIDLEAAVRNALANRTDLLTAKKNIDSANVHAAQPEQSDAADVEPAGHLPSRWPRRHDAPTGCRPASPADQLVERARRHRQLGSADLDGADATSPIRSARARRKPTRRDSRSSFGRTRRPSRRPSCRSRPKSPRRRSPSATRSKRFRRRRRRRELSVKRAEAAQSKLDVGMATNFEVVQAQRDLADARNRELREHLNYRRALVDFQRTQISPR